MATELRIASQRILTTYNNDEDFSLNPTTDFALELKGSFERYRAITTVHIGVQLELRNWLFLDGDASTGGQGSPVIIRRSSGDFINEGFYVGATFTIYTSGGKTFDGEILSITPTEIYAEQVSILREISFNDNSEQAYATGEKADYIVNTTPLTGGEFKYGLIENNEATNYLSKLTNQEIVYRFEDIDTSVTGTKHIGEFIGVNKAAKNGNITIEYLGKILNPVVGNQANTWNSYSIVHDFKGVPFFRDGEEDALQKLESSPTDLFASAKSLKYVFQLSLFKSLPEVNTKQTASNSNRNGSFGYYGESFNGFESNYTVSNLKYENEDAEEVDRLSVGDITKVSFRLSDSTNNFTNDNPLEITHWAKKSSIEYAFNNSELYDVWTLETKRCVTGGSTVNGKLIKNLSATFVDSGNIDVEFEIEFTADQISILEQNQNYLLSFTCGRGGATNVNFSKKVTDVIDYNFYDKSADITDLLKVSRFEQYPHPLDWVSSGESAGYTNAKFDVEEGGLAFCEFGLDTAKKAKLESLNCNIIVYQTITGERNILRSRTVNLSDEVIIETTNTLDQKLFLDSTVGFNLKSGDQFNFLKLDTTTKVGDIQFYELLCGYKIPWQEWMSFLDANPIFYRQGELKNGLNQFTNNYASNRNSSETDGKENYQIRIEFEAVVSQDGISTTYRTKSEDCLIYGYDEDDKGSPDTYTCAIKTFNEAGVEIEGKIIENDYTEIRAFFTPDSTPTFSESVDFTQAVNDFGKFAHGNMFVRIPPLQTRLKLDQDVNTPAWINNQASGSYLDANPDAFMGNGGLASLVAKDDPSLYVTTTDEILSQENLAAFYGLFSDYQLEFYTLTGSMFSDNTIDNDLIAYIIAFKTDEFGVEHTLSLLATTGGMLLENDPTYDPDDINSDVIDGSPSSPDNEASFALVYNYLKEDCVRIQSFNTGEVGFNWGNALVGDLMFEVTRAGGDISVNVDWTINGNNFNETFDYNLSDNDYTEKFIGAQSIGFAFLSQDQGGIKDVVLERPASDFYSVLRLDPELSPTDFEIAQLSDKRESAPDNLLVQIDGDEVKADFDFAGGVFLTRGRVNTGLIQEGQNYKMSAIIGALDLGTLNLKISYAFVLLSNPDTLYLIMNNDSNIIDKSGLNFSGTPTQPNSYVSGDGGRVLEFSLTGDLTEGEVVDLVVGGTNITPVHNSVTSLNTTSIPVIIS